MALKSYLYLSARNNCLNYLRHHQIVTEFENKLPQDNSDESTWNTIVESEIISILSEYINKLPPECKKIMEFDLQGYKSSEIASQTGATASTVRTQKQRGISLLRKMMSPELFTLFIAFFRFSKKPKTLSAFFFEKKYIFI